MGDSSERFVNPAEHDSIVSAVRRAEQAYCEQVTQAETLDFGVAFTSGAFPHSADGNQFREVQLGGTPIAEAFEAVERYYAQRNLTCFRWVPAMNEPLDAYDAFLPSRGFIRRDRLALVMADWPATAPPDPAVRIIPARAMRRAYRATFLDPGDSRWSEESKGRMADEAEERMNDANYDVFVAMLGDRPAGRVGYHEVGDIAALRDLYVVQAVRRAGVGRALTMHVVMLAKRLSPRLLVTSLADDEPPGSRYVGRIGFVPVGRMAEFDRGAI
jgi:GNAT superfamily N-acetyltransferase